MTPNPLFRRKPKPWRRTGTRQIASFSEIKLLEDRLVSNTGFRMKHPRLILHDFSVIVPVLDRNRLVFVWNYRPTIEGWELELPAGLLNDGESLQTCAKRELAEETGYSARRWRKLGWFHTTPALSSQRGHVYLAKELEKGRVHREPYEHMRTRIVSVRNAYRMLWSGKLVHASTLSALSFAEKILQPSSK